MGFVHRQYVQQTGSMYNKPEVRTTNRSLFFRNTRFSRTCFRSCFSESDFSYSLMTSSKQISASSLSISAQSFYYDTVSALLSITITLRWRHTLQVFVFSENNIVHQKLLAFRPRGPVGQLVQTEEDLPQLLHVPPPQFFGLLLNTDHQTNVSAIMHHGWLTAMWLTLMEINFWRSTKDVDSTNCNILHENMQTGILGRFGKE